MTATAATLERPEQQRLRAVIYVRISQDRTGAGLGVRRQQKDCEQLAERMGFQIVAPPYVDNDMSASSGKPRPDYLRLLDDLRGGLADVVLVWHTDRLHRRPVELEEFITIAEAHKPAISVHAVQAGPLDLATPSGRMVARQLAAVARYEVELKGERTKRANLQRAQAGKPTGGARPFGFEPDGITHRKDEAKAIRNAAKAVLTGTSLNKIAKDWNAVGMLSVFGKPWRATTLRQMLVRPRNAGLSVYQDEVIGAAVWKPILPEDQWRAVCLKMEDPSRRTGPGNQPRWLLSGIARCGASGCDCTVRIATATSHGGRYASRAVYRCRSLGTGHVARAAGMVDEFVTELIVARLSRPDAIELLRVDDSEDLDALQADADVLRVRLDELATLHAEGEVTASQLATGTKTLRTKLADLDSKIAAHTRNTLYDGVIGAADVRKVWDGHGDREGLDISRKRAIIDALCTVTILPAGRGSTFRPELIDVTWHV